MKAMVWTEYGPPEVLQLQEVAAPTPGDNEVLVKIHATSVTAGDCELRGLKLPLWLFLLLRTYAGWRRPHRITILGQELAGEITAVGSAVTRFQVGDQVFGTTGMRFGAYAEQQCLPEDAVLAHKPAQISYASATCLPVGGIEAAFFLGRADLQPGQQVLINGAGGSIGTLAIQLARRLGAQVTAVDSADKLEMLRRIGAHHVVDYTREDVTRSGRTYDVILDVVGKLSYARAVHALTPTGVFLIANPRLSHMLRRRWTSLTSHKRVVCWEERSGRAEQLLLQELADLASTREIQPVIDRTYPLEQLAAAHRYVESGCKQGNVVITTPFMVKSADSPQTP